ncbi:ATP synthase subunit I, partial [Hydrogenophaga sp.]|uniref:N-ATPase subunit AtpR n=1 Tax=Hydrogenophaga sp. TaxID=1904254 RepID=UPI003564274F
MDTMQTHELWPLLLAGLAGLALGVFFFGGLWWTLKKSLGACAAEGVESENRPQRGQFLPDVQPHSPAM